MYRLYTASHPRLQRYSYIYLTVNPKFSVAFQFAQGHEFFNLLAVGQDIRIRYHKRHFEFFTDYLLPIFFGFNDAASSGLLTFNP